MTTTIEKPMQKCHSIIVTGKVQDIGFRSVVEHIGRKLDKGNEFLKNLPDIKDRTAGA